MHTSHFVNNRQEYKQANAIEKMQDYLVCMTESMLSSAVMDLKDFWTEVVA